MAALSASILNLEKVSIHDSFFDLGGNSLLATRLIFQAKEQFEVQIPLRQLFLQPTVAGLSEAIALAQQNKGQSSNGSGHGLGQQPLLNRMTLEELQADVQLDPAIRAAGLPPARTAGPQHVLLTGATGFVGAFLLRDLLADTGAVDPLPGASGKCEGRAGTPAPEYGRLWAVGCGIRGADRRGAGRFGTAAFRPAGGSIPGAGAADRYDCP